MNKKGISRRDFLKGAAAGAGTLALTALTGCATENNEECPVCETSTSNETVSSWRIAPEHVADSEIVEEYTADVCVCGHGYAGVTACREIAESGKSVILIESQAEDMYQALGNEAGLPNMTKLLERGVDPIDPVEFFNNWMLNTNNTANPGLMMKFAQHAGENGDWYHSELTDSDWEAMTTAFYPQTEKMLHEIGPFKFWSSTASFYSQECNQTKIQGYNRQKAIDNGAKFLWSTEAQYLEQNADGSIKAVVATNGEGKYIRINCTCAVLATGGFGGNKEMQKDLLTDLKGCMNDPEDFGVLIDRDGRGIQMATWAGAKLESFGIATMNGKHFYPGYPQALWLDPDGKRYCNEFWGPIEFRGRPALFKKKDKYYAFYDSNITEYLKYVAPSHGSNYPTEDYLAGVEETIQKALAAGKEGVPGQAMSATYTTYAAETLDELFELIGVSGEVKEQMLKSINRYNEMCDNKYDADFGRQSNLLFPVKEGPFCCDVKEPVIGWMMCTCGGILTDEEQQVLGENFEPIPGLFASGNCCGRRFGTEYFTPIPGVSLGTVVTLGRECGRSVVKYLNGEL